MAKISSWLAVTAVVALGVAVVLSSVLTGDGNKAGPAVSTAAVSDRRTATLSAAEVEQLKQDAAAQALAPEGVLGTLYLADERCRLRALHLPDLTPASVPSMTACRFAAASGTRPAPRGYAWQPGGRLVASCRGGRTRVFDPRSGSAARSGEPVLDLDGCAPAWKPAGQLTFVRRGELVLLGRSCTASTRQCLQVILSRNDLAKAFRDTPSLRSLRSPSVSEVAWLSDDAFVAILRGERSDGKRRDLVALFSDSRLVASPPLRQPHLSLLRVSPQRTYAAVQADSTDTWVLRAQGASLTIERFPPWSPPAPTDVKAIAWSPDERWTAIASRTSVYVFRTTKSEDGFIGLPFRALDLAWGAAG